MAVYLDAAKNHFGRMKMCHVIASTDDELHAMMDKIGIARRWCQYDGTYRIHYDISLVKRKLAIEAGAIEITRRELGAMLAFRMKHQRLCHPKDAVAWARERIKGKAGAA